jgi:hypothetical protein
VRFIRSSAPVPAAADGRLDIHMALCHRDVALGLVALKSLMRFLPQGVAAVSLSDDGTLTTRDRETLSSHVPGCRLIDRGAAELATAFDGRPALERFYRSGHVFGPKLLHPTTMSRGRKTLVLDADTGFFRSPARLLAWLDDPSDAALFLHDHRDQRAAVPPAVRRTYADALAAAGAPAGVSVGHYFFNAGLLAFGAGTLDLDIAERYLAWRSAHAPALAEAPLATWFGTWTVEQTAYQLMYAASTVVTMPFGDEYVVGYDSQRTFCHFLRHHLVQDLTLSRLAVLVDELRSASTAGTPHRRAKGSTP